MRILITLCVLSVSAWTQIVRDNVGGGSYTDGSGYVWSASAGCNGSSNSTTASTIVGTADQPLYQTARYGTPITCTYTLPAGNYTVTLKYAEHLTFGARTQDVAINGTTVETDFVISAAAGGYLTAVDKSYPATSNGTITITFTHKSSSTFPWAWINAIQILPTVVPTITTTTLPDGGVGVAYSQKLAAADAAPTWSVSAGALPGGLSLSATTGIISGTPTLAGHYTFTVMATTAAGSDTQDFTLDVPGIVGGEVLLNRGATHQFTGYCPSGHTCRWQRLPQSTDSGSTVTTGGLYTAPASVPRGSSLGGCPLQPHNTIWKQPVTTLTSIATASDIASRLYTATTFKTIMAYPGPMPNLVKSNTPTTYLVTDHTAGGGEVGTYLGSTPGAWNDNYQLRTPQYYVAGVGTRDYPEMTVQAGARVTGADNRYISINKDTCEVQEIYFAVNSIESNVLAVPNPAYYLVPSKYNSMTFLNGWGLRKNRTGPNAGGMWLSPMQIDWGELARVADRDGATGNLGHRIAMTIDNDMFPTNDTIFNWPAIRAAGGCWSCTTDLSVLAPYGTVFRLKQSAIDAFNFHQAATTYGIHGNATRIENMLHVWANTVRDYGLVVMDGERKTAAMHGRGSDGTPDPEITQFLITNSATFGADFLHGLEAVTETRMVPGMDGSNVVRDPSANPEGVVYYDVTADQAIGTVDIAVNPGTVGTLSPVAHVVSGAGPVDLAEDTWATGWADNSALVWTANPNNIGTLNASTGAYTPPSVGAAPSTPTSVTVTACHATDSTACATKRVIVYPAIGTGLYLRGEVTKVGANFVDPQGRKWWGADSNGLQLMLWGGGGRGLGAVVHPAGSDYPDAAYNAGGYGEKIEKLYLPNGTYKVTTLMSTWGVNQHTANTQASIDINGVEKVAAWDFWTEAGGDHKGINKTVTATVTDGRMVHAVRSVGTASNYYPWVTGLVLESVQTVKSSGARNVRMSGRVRMR